MFEILNCREPTNLGTGWLSSAAWGFSSVGLMRSTMDDGLLPRRGAISRVG